MEIVQVSQNGLRYLIKYFNFQPISMSNNLILKPLVFQFYTYVLHSFHINTVNVR